MMQDFRKAQKLSVCHKLVKCYVNLQDKSQRTTSLLRYKENTHLRLFRPDQGPRTVEIRRKKRLQGLA